MRRSVLRILKNVSVLIGLLIILLLFTTTLFAGWIAPSDPIKINLQTKLLPPGGHYLCGTDSLGRDIFSRIVYGSRVSSLIALSCVLIGSLFGVTVGIFSGFFGGKVDEFLMRIMDMILAFPSLILAMAIAASLGPGISSAVYAVGFVQIPMYARIARGSTLSIREQNFILASRSFGAGSLRLVFVNILPNILSPIIVNATLGLGSAILTAAGLSFLGLGAQPPMPEWGQMIAEGRAHIVSGEWWVTAFPGLAIMATVLSFNLVGDGLRDILDPRLHGKK
jgi:peptide/nickel transport system permease protein